jgi:hypothetical protein
MNEQSKSGIRDGDEELAGVLSEVVKQICAEPPPADALQDTLHRAAACATAEQGRGAGAKESTYPDLLSSSRMVVADVRSPRLALSIAASLAVVALAAAVLGFLLMRRENDVRIAQRDRTSQSQSSIRTTGGSIEKETDAMKRNGEQQRVTVDGATAQGDGRESKSFGVSNNLGVTASDGIEPASEPDGASPRGGVAAPRGFGAQARGDGRFAGASPSRWVAVASEATILVSTGAAEPIELGARQPWNDKTILHVWDWTKATKSKPLEAQANRSLVLSPDGTKVVTNDGRVIDTATGEITRLENFEGDIYRVKISRDGRMLVVMIYGGGNQGTARLLEFPSGKKICEIPDIFPHMFVADFLRDGKQIVLVGTDLRTRRFETASGKELMKYEPAHSNSVRAVAISNDGKFVVSSGPANETYLWDADTGMLLHKLDVRQQPNVINEVYSLAFSPDDKLLSGGGAQNLVLWNTETGAVEEIYPTTSGGAVHILF